MTQVTESVWLAAFRDAVERNDPASALAAIDPRATAHAGTANVADKRAATKTVVNTFAPRPEALQRWAVWMASHESATAKELGAMLLARSYSANPEQSVALLQRLADDSNWEVREWAGSSAGDLLDAHFDQVYPVMERWVAHDSQFVRRAVAIAVRGAANPKKPERCEPIFRLVDVLVRDSSEEVKRNTGPFAVGGSLLARYPDATIARVRAWAAEEGEMPRWNAAMVFVAANARKHVDAGLDILSGLARDPRKAVWMGVASALKNLVKRDPDRVIPALKTWLRDDRKLPAALALRHTTLDRP